MGWRVAAVFGLAWASLSLACTSETAAPGDDAQNDASVTPDASGADDGATSSADAASPTTDGSGPSPDASPASDASASSDADADLTADGADAADGGDSGDAAPACATSDLIAIEEARTVITARFAEAAAVGLVFEPSLEALSDRATVLNRTADALTNACDPALVAKLTADVTTLGTDVSAWIATPPLGITTAPPTFVVVGDSVSFDARVSGGAGVYTFTLKTAPAGMAIDATTGHLTYAPTAGDKGDHHVVLEAASGGATATQDFTLRVATKTLLSSQAITTAAIDITVTGTGSALDGAVVRVPAGAVAGPDTLELSVLDPAPPLRGEGRLLGPALALALTSGAAQFEVPVRIELPAAGLATGEVASLLSWAPGAAGSSHGPFGAYGFTDDSPGPVASAAAGQVIRPGTTAAGATTGAPLRRSANGFVFVAEPGTPQAAFDIITASMEDAKAFVVSGSGYLDPTADGPVTVSLRQIPPGDSPAWVPDRQSVVMSRDLRGLWLDNVAAHELFHVVQFHTPWKKGHGVLKYKGGARWWMEATAQYLGETFAPTPKGSRLVLPKRIVEQTLVTHDSSGSQYDSFIFFDYLTRQKGFSLKGFWESVNSVDLMLPEGAGQQLFVYGGQLSGGLPYLPFVHAYVSDRTAQNFALLGAATAAPNYATQSMPDTEAPYALATDEALSFLSSRTFVVATPPGDANNLVYATVTGPPSVKAWIYEQGAAAPLAQLSGGDGEITLGTEAQKTLVIHLANTAIDFLGDTTASLSLRAKLVPLKVPPTTGWMTHPNQTPNLWNMPLQATPLAACAYWVATLTNASNPHIIEQANLCYASNECCWYTSGGTSEAGNIGVIQASRCPDGYTLSGPDCLRN